MDEPQTPAPGQPKLFVGVAAAAVAVVTVVIYFVTQGLSWDPGSAGQVLGLGVTFAAPLLAVVVTRLDPGVRLVMGVSMLIGGLVLSLGSDWPVMFLGVPGFLLLLGFRHEDLPRLRVVAYWTMIVVALMGASYYAAVELWPVAVVGALIFSAVVVLSGMRVASGSARA